MEEIEICFYPMSEMFERLPRDTQSVAVVRALYETLDQEPGVEAGLDTGSEIAILEALSEMQLSASIVPKDFWPLYWDSRKDRFLNFLREQGVTSADKADFRERLLATLDRLGLTP